MDITDSEPTPTRAVVIEAIATGEVGEHGDPLFVVETTVLTEGEVPKRVRMHVAVPSHAIAQLHPGAELDVEWVANEEGITPLLRFSFEAARHLATDSTTRSTTS